MSDLKFTNCRFCGRSGAIKDAVGLGSLCKICTPLNFHMEMDAHSKGTKAEPAGCSHRDDFSYAFAEGGPAYQCKYCHGYFSRVVDGSIRAEHFEVRSGEFMYDLLAKANNSPAIKTCDHTQDIYLKDTEPDQGCYECNRCHKLFAAILNHAEVDSDIDITGTRKYCWRNSAYVKAFRQNAKIAAQLVESQMKQMSKAVGKAIDSFYAKKPTPKQQANSKEVTYTKDDIDLLQSYNEKLRQDRMQLSDKLGSIEHDNKQLAIENSQLRREVDNLNRKLNRK